MEYDLSDEYLADARQRAYRYQGQWTGTAGSLAADVARLLIERKRMQGHITSIEDANAQLRAAVESRLAGNVVEAQQAPPQDEPEEQIPMDWILQGQKEMEASTDDIRWTGDSILSSQPDGLRPGSVPFMEVLEEVKRLHIAKSQDYGADNDALANIRSGADVVNLAPWKACLIRLADKMTRLRTVCHTGSCTFDGVDDTLKDICAYSAIALVLYREGQSDPV
jgi:hypothetical protein